jgi:hypothetical protein
VEQTLAIVHVRLDEEAQQAPAANRRAGLVFSGQAADGKETGLLVD